MLELERQNLNIKLALFCGFKHPINKSDNTPFNRLWETPISGNLITELPDFINDANVQISYIYPELKRRKVFHGINSTIDSYVAYTECYGDFKRFEFKNEQKDNPTLAFALAVSKYIDSLFEQSLQKEHWQPKPKPPLGQVKKLD
jgi:hypothetical protein